MTRSTSIVFVSVLWAVAVAMAFGAPVSAKRADATGAAPPSSSTIDDGLAAMWTKAGVKPAARASDAEFLRRVALDLVGRIPTPGEVNGFLSDTKADKRARMVDRFLASKDYAQHWADVYMDLTIGRQLRLRPRINEAARGYFVAQFAANRPIDALVGELVSSTGDADTKPASIYTLSFLLRGKNVAQMAGTTARLFLGQQIQCAQCHDHPYDKRYKQSDFAAFAGYYKKLRRYYFRDPLFGGVIASFESDGLPPRQLRRNNPYVFATPRFLGTNVPANASVPSLLGELATRIRTSPLFAMVTVNRTWRFLFGRALSEPWDDLRALTDPKHPALLGRLAREFARNGYDHKRLLRAIVLSSAYQRTSRHATAKQRRVFAAATVRPLSADQLFRSQLLATGFSEAIALRRGRDRLERFKHQMLRQYLFTFADDDGKDVDAFTGSVAQALLLRNHFVTNQGARVARGTVLRRIFDASGAPEQRLRWMFMAAYSRHMTTAERARYLGYLKRRGNVRQAYEDLFHAMITSTEFLSNH